MPENYASHRLRLQLEFSKLLDWGDEAGIQTNQGAFDKRMKVNGVVVMAVLGELRSLLKSIRLLSLDYDKVLETEPEARITNLPRRNQSIDSIDLKEYFAMFETGEVSRDKRTFPKGMKSVLQFARNVKSLGHGVKSIGHHRFKGVRWAMRDAKKFEHMLERLTQLTAYLHQTLGDDKMQTLLEYSRENCMAVLQLTQNVGQIQELLKAIHGAYIQPTTFVETASILSQADTVVNRDDVDDALAESPRSATIFQRLAEFRAINSNISHIQVLDGLDDPVIDLSKLELGETTDDGSRTLAQYQGTNVWIEWKSYSAVLVDDLSNAPHRVAPEDAALNAKRLVALLRAKAKPTEFCVPGCLGYFDDLSVSHNQRFGFVYQVATKDGGGLEPKSLAKLLDDSKPAAMKQRIILAQQLATCLLYFHAVNWLHKSLRSASIIFVSSSSVVDYTRPYITSFEYSRPDLNSETFQGAPETPEFKTYCHPDYLGRPDLYRKTFDMYSLGIILLEIALWKPAKDVFSGWEEATNGKGGAKTSPKLNIQQRLLGDGSHGGNPEVLEQVRDSMGDRYHNAVRACIAGLDYFKLPKDVDQTDPVIATLLQQAYLRLVVDALHGISV
jgi:hypothetical protein